MPKSRSESGKTRRKCPKRCTLAIYHTGAVILFVGIVVAIIGIATARLFHVYVYDHRKPARFLNLHIPVGLFSVSGEVTWLSLEQEPLPHALELGDIRWILAKMMTMIGLFVAVASFFLHITMSCCRTHQSWLTVMFEICGLLLAVIAILIGLSLAESEIEYIHDHGDSTLAQFLSANGLLNDNDLPNPADSAMTLPESDADPMDHKAALDSGDFALYLTPPQISFSLLIAADFLLLLAFLAVLIYFVRVCEEAVQTRKQLRRAETSHI
ncbi:hypothetical protein P879_01062 [Paragonimus westermani]|uniref:Uncharacterized protein n=1 Tax=Paragonimus westermani TaxID=34504 RepID=A0A8T0DL80_9TREM|nr:hypothetical protein P879_01062 [Paragonimus westermani]